MQNNAIHIVKTKASNSDFVALVTQLNAYLKITDGNEHEFYNQYNGLDSLTNVVVLYVNNKAAACGAFKPFNKTSVEIKRMFTLPEYRAKGLATKVLTALEIWANQLGYTTCVLETGKRQTEAVNFYKKSGYSIIPNFEPYKNMKNSICFKKELKK